MSNEYNRSIEEILESIDEFSPYKIKPSDYKEVIKEYCNGCSVKELSEKYNVNLQTIYRILRKCEIKPNGAGRPKSLSDDNIKKIINLYEEGYSSVYISKKYEVSATTILNIIKSNGVKTKKNGPRSNNLSSDHNHKFKRKVSKEDHEIIVKKYLNGISTPKLSKEFNISRERVCKILESMGVERRSKGIGKKESDEIISLYKEGKSVKQISDEIKRSKSAIVSVIKSNGIKVEKGRSIGKQRNS